MNGYSPFDDVQEPKSNNLVIGYYILEFVGAEFRVTKANQPVLVAKLRPQARSIQENGNQQLELPANKRNIEAAFWLFSAPKDEFNQRIKGIGFERNPSAGANLSKLFQIVSGYSLVELKRRFSAEELEKEGIELVEPELSPNGTPDHTLILNAIDITAQWAEFLNAHAIENNTDPDVRNHKLFKAYVTLKESNKTDSFGNPYVNPEITYVENSGDPLYIPLSTRELEMYQEMFNQTSSTISEDDFVLPDGSPRF